MTQNTFFHISVTWPDSSSNCLFLTGYSKKMFKVTAHYLTTGTGMVSLFVDSCQWCSASDQSRLH